MTTNTDGVMSEEVDTLYGEMSIEYYRSFHAEDDWDDGLSKFTATQYYGLFNLFSRQLVDKQALKAFLDEKHFYWQGTYGYFNDHWRYWFETVPKMKDSPYFYILSYPAQSLVLGCKLIEMEKRYGRI